MNTPVTGSARHPALVRIADVAAVMRKIADLLEIKGEDPFHLRAYRKPARTVDKPGPSVQGMLAEHRDLDDLPGVDRARAERPAPTQRTQSRYEVSTRSSLRSSDGQARSSPACRSLTHCDTVRDAMASPGWHSASPVACASNWLRAAFSR